MIDRRQFLAAAMVGSAALAIGTRAVMAAQTGEDALFRDPDAPVLGNPTGDVTVVEFFDYQCPYCKKSHADVLSVVREDGNVRLVMKDWPVFGDVSVFASQAVLGARELGGYEKAMEALMATPAGLSEDEIQTILTSAGFDFGKIAAAVRTNDRKISGLLTRNYEQAVALNFSGTPSFVIGKTMTSGVLSKDQLRDAIRKARAA